MQSDSYWMEKALFFAKESQRLGEVPVGAVLVLEGEMIGCGMNSPIAHHDPSAHAEINALRCGGKNLENYRLLNTTLYVTLEPCIMCIGACIYARIKRLVFGAFDNKIGGATKLYSSFNFATNHQVSIEGGVLEQECTQLLKDFFQSRRQV